MQLVFKINEFDQYIENNGIVYFLGPNQNGKSYFLSQIKEGFEGKNKNFSVNNCAVVKEDYNVIFFNDTTDFTSEFKFTKNNNFRKIIYDNVFTKIDENQIVKDMNGLLNEIDKQVNHFLNIHMNKKQEEKILFDIDITDINDIIDKFTNIYIDDYLLKDGNVPRSVKRKLIYNLLMLELQQSDSINIVLIDDFDLYLDLENTKKVIDQLESYHSKNPDTYFFVTSSSNLYPYIKNKSNIYHTGQNRASHIVNLDPLIRDCFLKEVYQTIDQTIDFDSFQNETDYLYELDIEKKQKDVLCQCQEQIGLIYVSSKVHFTMEEMVSFEDGITIYCSDSFFYSFYETIVKILHFID